MIMMRGAMPMAAAAAMIMMSACSGDPRHPRLPTQSRRAHGVGWRGGGVSVTWRAPVRVGVERVSWECQLRVSVESVSWEWRGGQAKERKDRERREKDKAAKRKREESKQKYKKAKAARLAKEAEERRARAVEGMAKQAVGAGCLHGRSWQAGAPMPRGLGAAWCNGRAAAAA
jgi:hypothetical protein